MQPSLAAFFCNVVQLSCAETFGLLYRPDIMVWYPVFEHVIDNAGDLMCHGDECLDRAKSPLQAQES